MTSYLQCYSHGNRSNKALLNLYFIAIFEAILRVLVNRGLLMYIVIIQEKDKQRKEKKRKEKKIERKENYRRDGTQPTKANSNKTKQNKTEHNKRKLRT